MSKIESGYFKKDLPANVIKIGGILFAAGLLLGIAGYFVDSTRAAFSYLTSFMFFLSIGIGALFLIALEYLVNAEWSVPFRRVTEFLASSIPFLLILAIPLLFSIHDLFHWSHAEAVAEDRILQEKSSYLNVPFFIIRVFVVFGIWTLFYFLFTRNSRKQDGTGDQNLTRKNARLSAIFMPIFAITLTVSAVDWMMSLEPHWFSTIFGVYLFAGSTWVALAAITLIVILLHEKGYLHKRITTDHYYSLGTLLFAFTVFWGYIAFSQYMLIWYADLPEETFWFAQRWEGGWLYLSVLLMISHFLVPFIALLSFAAKTNPKRLKFMSIWILAAHFIDLYWLIMPTLSNTPGGYTLSWMDAAYPAFVIGLLIIVFNMRSKKDNLIPIGDPKLERGLDFRL
jgi:hypothetical protein